MPRLQITQNCQTVPEKVLLTFRFLSHGFLKGVGSLSRAERGGGERAVDRQS